MKPDLDSWLPDPTVRVAHRRESEVAPERLWAAAREVQLADTAVLGRLVRWRIPGTTLEQRFDELFREAPFLALEESDGALVSGIVGRIWTLRRDYPVLEDPEQFRDWSRRGSARVLFANWVDGAHAGKATLHAEVRVQAFGAQGRFGVRAVRPLISGFQQLIGSEGIEAAVRLAAKS